MATKLAAILFCCYYAACAICDSIPRLRISVKTFCLCFGAQIFSVFKSSSFDIPTSKRPFSLRCLILADIVNPFKN